MFSAPVSVSLGIIAVCYHCFIMAVPEHFLKDLHQ